MSRGVNPCNRNHIADPAPIRLSCASHKVHTHTRIDVIWNSLLRDNVEALDISNKVIKMQRVKYHSQLDN